MSTTFEHKCGILSELWLTRRFVDNPEWVRFLTDNDDALPAAYLITQGFLTLPDTAEGKELASYIDATWIAFCQLVDSDPDGDYANIRAAEAAPPAP